MRGAADYFFRLAVFFWDGAEAALPPVRETVLAARPAEDFLATALAAALPDGLVLFFAVVLAAGFLTARLALPVGHMDFSGHFLQSGAPTRQRASP